MLYREIIAVCSQIHTQHINNPSGQNVEWLNVKLVVHTYSIVTNGKDKGKGHPCTGTEALYRLYGP
jgi:hypothetical protein